MTNYQQTRSIRRESRTIVDRTRAGKLTPCMAVEVGLSEGGMLSQSITCELDPIAGRLVSPVEAEFVSVFVPTQAIDAIKDPEAAYAGMSEVIRAKLLEGNPLFGLEAEGEISMRCDITPAPGELALAEPEINGPKRVSEAVRLAHNVAVNHLRRLKYHKATLLDHTNTAVTPAILKRTVLELFNGVLDPDDRINGSFEMSMPEASIPVSGIGFDNFGQPAYVDNRVLRVTPRVPGDAGVATAQTGRGSNAASTQANPQILVNAANYPQVYAELDETVKSVVSLRDLYNAETQDRLVRTMKRIVAENPEYGEEMVLRWAYGLSVDPGKTPFVLARRSATFGRSIVGATDTSGIENDVMRSDMALMIGFDVAVPKTELGGYVITFLTVRPDEYLSAQPHPYSSRPFGLENRMADELALDAVPVTMQELDAYCPVASKNTVAFYTANNQLKTNYVSYGYSRRLDRSTVDAKTAVWRVDIPLSVTPDNILYPEDISHYPFADQQAEVCLYTCTSNLTFQSPVQVGPTPVETLAVIDEENLFEQEE